MPDQFESLPDEAILRILSDAPDIPSMHALALASPTAHRILVKFGSAIFENVFPRSLPREMLFAVRCIAVLKQSTTANPADKCDDPACWEFLELYAASLRRDSSSDFAVQEEDMEDMEDAEDMEDMEDITNKLYDGTSFCGLIRDAFNDNPDALSPLDLIDLVRNIAMLAEECQASNRELTPHWFQGDPDPTEECQHSIRRCRRSCCPRCSDVRNAGSPIYGAPPWLEMQGIMRGLWRVQLQEEMMAAAVSGRLTGEHDIDLTKIGRFFTQFVADTAPNIGETIEMVMAQMFIDKRSRDFGIEELQ